MFKVHLLTPCVHCKGKASIPLGEAIDSHGQRYPRQLPCPSCDGTGQCPHWIDLQALAHLLVQAQCPHMHTSFKGGLHFSAGDVWDDISEVCDDCGAVLDRQTLGEYIHDPETVSNTR